MPKAKYFRIEIQNEQRLMRVNLSELKALAKSVLLREKSRYRQVTIRVCDDRAIRKMHGDFMGKDTPTDVMAFESCDDRRSDYLGDVIVSAETARRVCGKYAVSAKEEIYRYVTHGLLHLLGYDDHRRKEYDNMHAKQEKLLRDFLGDKKT